MKKYFLLVLMVLTIGVNNSNANDSTTFVVKGNMYSKVVQSKQKSEPTQTPYVYQVGGQELPILLSANGRAYVIRISQKTGNEYKYYLGEEISRDICKKMGVEYVEKK